MVIEDGIEELEQRAQKDDSLLKGMSVTTLARTKDKYKIGETEEYWYYVSYYYFEDVDYEGWIYGGSLEAIDSSKLDEYVQILINAHRQPFVGCL